MFTEMLSRRYRVAHLSVLSRLIQFLGNVAGHTLIILIYQISKKSDIYNRVAALLGKPWCQNFKFKRNKLREEFANLSRQKFLVKNNNKTSLKNVDPGFKSAGPNTRGRFFSPAQRFLRYCNNKKLRKNAKPKRKRNLTAVMLICKTSKSDARRSEASIVRLHKNSNQLSID